MKSIRMGWTLAISGGVALMLMTAACGTLVRPWGGAPTASQYSAPAPWPSTEASCDGGTAYSAQTACGSPWHMQR
jgi:hypothetical protein